MIIASRNAAEEKKKTAEGDKRVRWINWEARDKKKQVVQKRRRC